MKRGQVKSLESCEKEVSKRIEITFCGHCDTRGDVNELMFVYFDQRIEAISARVVDEEASRRNFGLVAGDFHHARHEDTDCLQEPFSKRVVIIMALIVNEEVSWSCEAQDHREVVVLHHEQVSEAFWFSFQVAAQGAAFREV